MLMGFIIHEEFNHEDQHISRPVLDNYIEIKVCFPSH